MSVTDCAGAHSAPATVVADLGRSAKKMNPDYILLCGIKNPKALEDYFASTLVDVAYAEPIGGDQVKIFVESDTDIRKEEDVNWIFELIVGALRESGENEFATKVVLTK